MSTATTQKKFPIHISTLSVLFFFLPFVIYFTSRSFGEDQAIPLSQIEIWTFFCYWSAAILVWSRFKFFWLLIVLGLSSVVVVNLITAAMYFQTDKSYHYNLQFIWSISTMAIALLFVQHLNANYFDRRDQFSLLGASERYDVNLPAVLKSSSGIELRGKVISVSLSGAKFEFENLPETFYLLGTKLSIAEMDLNNQPIQIVEISPRHIRLKFDGLGIFKVLAFRKKLKKA